MTLLLVLLVLTALAVLAPRYGTDSRDLDRGGFAPSADDDRVAGR